MSALDKVRQEILALAKGQASSSLSKKFLEATRQPSLPAAASGPPAEIQADALSPSASPAEPSTTAPKCTPSDRSVQVAAGTPGAVLTASKVAPGATSSGWMGNFDRLDLNRDGVIDREEYSKVSRPQMVHHSDVDGTQRRILDSSPDDPVLAPSAPKKSVQNVLPDVFEVFGDEPTTGEQHIDAATPRLESIRAANWSMYDHPVPFHPSTSSLQPESQSDLHPPSTAGNAIDVADFAYYNVSSAWSPGSSSGLRAEEEWLNDIYVLSPPRRDPFNPSPGPSQAVLKPPKPQQSLDVLRNTQRDAVVMAEGERVLPAAVRPAELKAQLQRRRLIERREQELQKQRSRAIGRGDTDQALKLKLEIWRLMQTHDASDGLRVWPKVAAQVQPAYTLKQEEELEAQRRLMEGREAERLRTHLHRAVSPEVVEDLAESLLQAQESSANADWLPADLELDLEAVFQKRSLSWMKAELKGSVSPLAQTGGLEQSNTSRKDQMIERAWEEIEANLVRAQLEGSMSEEALEWIESELLRVQLEGGTVEEALDGMGTAWSKARSEEVLSDQALQNIQRALMSEQFAGITSTQREAAMQAAQEAVRKADVAEEAARRAAESNKAARQAAAAEEAVRQAVVAEEAAKQTTAAEEAARRANAEAARRAAAAEAAWQAAVVAEAARQAATEQAALQQPPEETAQQAGAAIEVGAAKQAAVEEAAKPEEAARQATAAATETATRQASKRASKEEVT